MAEREDLIIRKKELLEDKKVFLNQLKNALLETEPYMRNYYLKSIRTKANNIEREIKDIESILDSRD